MPLRGLYRGEQGFTYLPSARCRNRHNENGCFFTEDLKIEK